MRREIADQVCGGRLLWRAGLTLVALAVFAALLADRLRLVAPDAVFAALGQVGPLAWIGAALATAASFTAIAGYDVTLHRHLGTGIASGRAGRAGLAAIAVSQMVGMGLLSGALVRWRMLPDLGLWAATRLTLAVTVSFLTAWAMVTALVLSVVPGAPLRSIAVLALVIGPAVLAIGLARRWRWMPNLITASRLILLIAMDCLAAALALAWLVPGGVEASVLLPAFLLALGAGLVSGSPGGLGAFEIVLIALLPDVAEADLLAGVLAWRLVYFAAPALVGAGLALSADHEPPPVRQPVRPLVKPAPEAGLLRQGDLHWHPAGAVTGRTAHALVALGGAADLGAFRVAARDVARWPVLYKIGPGDAAQARSHGFRVLPVALEAWLSPPDFRLDLPARAGLRRKLRKAEMAGIVVVAEADPPMAALAAVNSRWVAARGREFGFSMGRFAPGYVAGQRVVVARLGGGVVGFATFHEGWVGGESAWSLDLLRPDPDAPDGTVQAMIMAALRAAKAEGVQRLSLAAVPIGSCAAERGICARLGRRFAPRGSQGLAQFKAGFAPEWQRLYIAGPGWLRLALAGGEVFRAIHQPAPLPNMRQTPRRDAEYEFASDSGSWHRKAKMIL